MVPQKKYLKKISKLVQRKALPQERESVKIFPKYVMINDNLLIDLEDRYFQSTTGFGCCFHALIDIRSTK